MTYVSYLNLEYLFLFVYQLLTGEYKSDLPERLLELVHTTQVITTFLSLVLLMGIAYAALRWYQLKKEYTAMVKAEQLAAGTRAGENPKWREIVDLTGSANPNDWRQAILLADVMLGDLLDALGYRGDGIGEKLKSVEPGDFPTLDLAWDAHRVRNEIAHAGSDFLLTQREARRTIDLYRRVFESFQFL
jgi:hypothetical protein